MRMPEPILKQKQKTDSFESMKSINSKSAFLSAFKPVLLCTIISYNHIFTSYLNNV